MTVRYRQAPAIAPGQVLTVVSTDGDAGAPPVADVGVRGAEEGGLTMSRSADGTPV
jgi:hypothetical protein